MKARSAPQLPADQERIQRRAVRLEWWTIALLSVGAGLMYAVMGSSQVMKTAWVEDVLSLIPPAAYLIAVRVRKRQPNRNFPYGYQRAISIAFLCASVALLAMGLFLLGDALISLLSAEHPTLHTVQVFGWRVWQGWLMIAALVITGIIPIVLGRLKLPLAKQLHDKALFADADMNKADWLTALSGIIGVLGIGLGYWWTDSVAAAFISFEITRDGVRNLKRVVKDLMDHSPTTVDRAEPHPIGNSIKQRIEQLPWVARAEVRLREEGHVFSGEVFVVPRAAQCSTQDVESASQVGRELDWKVCDLVVMPVTELPSAAKSR